METPARSEYAMRKATVLATPQECYDVAIDIAAYPDWAHAISDVSIDSRDDAGRPEKVTYLAEAIGRSTRYQIKYDLSKAPAVIAWSLVRGDIMAKLDGAYTFAESVDEPGATDVTYELSVDLAVAIPGFVKRRAEAKLIDFALPRFKSRVEGIVHAAA